MLPFCTQYIYVLLTVRNINSDINRSMLPLKHKINTYSLINMLYKGFKHLYIYNILTSKKAIIY